MFIAMEQFVGEKIATLRALIARGEPIHEFAIGAHFAKRSRIILARRAEQFRPGAVVRGAEYHDQFGALMTAKLVIRPRVSRGAAAWIDMRRDNAGERCGWLRRCRKRDCGAARRVGTLEKTFDFLAQPGRILFVAE